MKRVDVVKRGDKWVGETGKDKEIYSSGDTKVEAVRDTAAKAKADPQPVTVKIHKEDGKIQEERTYPRSADPRQSRG